MKIQTFFSKTFSDIKSFPFNILFYFTKNILNEKKIKIKSKIAHIKTIILQSYKKINK